MREIFFRAKSKGDLGTWIYGYYHYDKSLNEHYICTADNLIRHEIDPDTLGQLMYEDNGVKFFEDDLCITKDGDVFRIWIDRAFLMGGIEKEWDDFFNELTLLEPIGNIHDNPTQP